MIAPAIAYTYHLPNLMHQHIVDLPVLNAKIPHRDGRATVAVTLTDDLKANTVSYPLLVSPRFAKGM